MKVGGFDCSHLRVQLKIEIQPLPQKRKAEYIKPTVNQANFGMTQGFLDTLSDACSCPITLELFVEPVLASDGYTYERKALVKHFATNGPTSPMTRAPMARAVVSNRAIKQIVESARLNVKTLCE